ncbi:MAG: PotD/PotF family extracellular solute-binding protein [Bauldia sp.]
MSDFSLSRRKFNLGVAAVAASLPLMSSRAFAAGRVVAATFPNAWEDAYRRVIVPILQGQGTELVIAPALAQDQLAAMMASPNNPPYDALLMSPGQSAVAIENGLIQRIDPARLANWGTLDPAFQSEWGPAVTVEVNGIAYNPDVVPPPTGYQDLFENAAYDNKVAWIGFGSNTATMAYTEIAKIYGTGADDMEAVFDLFRSYLPKVGVIANSGSHQMTLYQQGEISVFMASTNNVATLKALGVPCEFVHPVTGSPAVPVNIHLTAGAANPDGVYEYMDAAISAAAQAELTMPPTETFPSNGTVPLTESIAAYVTREMLPSFVYPDWAMINAHRADWTREFDRIVAGG